MNQLVEKTVSRPGLFGLGVPSGLDEVKFRGWFLRRATPHVRLALMVAVGCLLLLMLLDVTLLADRLGAVGLKLRGIVVMPLVLGALYASRHPLWPRIFVPLLIAVVLAIGVGEVLLEHARHQGGAPAIYTVSPIVILAQYFHSRLPFARACLCGWTILGAKLGCVFLDGTPAVGAYYEIAIGVIANVLGMLAALEYQATMRRDFSHRLELRQLAERDGLTGVYNRRVQELTLASQWRQALEDKVSLVVLMVDIDFFKSYNDWFGHPRGDVCLKRIAATLEALARRPGDLCARYGGEEFCILFYGAAESCAPVLADAVRKAVRDCAIPHPGSSVASVVTVSVGAVVCRPRQGIGPSDLIEKADAALYAAKRGGRDRTVVEML